MKLVVLSLLGCSSFALAQPPTHSPPTVTRTVNGCNLDWDGQSGVTYFIQYSMDLKTWSYMPIIESGGGLPIGYGFQCDTDNMFVRLHYTDASTSNPNSADFDGDGISNWDEVRSGGAGTSPFKMDTDDDGQIDYFNDRDGNGLADGWELQHFGGVGSANPNADIDGDGLVNREESLMGSDPNNRNTDNDGKLDSEEAVWWYQSIEEWPRSKEVQYAVIVLNELGVNPSANYVNHLDMTQSGSIHSVVQKNEWTIQALSNAGHVLVVEDKRGPAGAQGRLDPSTINGSVKNHLWEPSTAAWVVLKNDKAGGAGQDALAVASDISADGKVAGYAWIPLADANGDPMAGPGVERVVVKWADTGINTIPSMETQLKGSAHATFSADNDGLELPFQVESLSVTNMGDVLYTESGAGGVALKLGGVTVVNDVNFLTTFAGTQMTGHGDILYKAPSTGDYQVRLSSGHTGAIAHGSEKPDFITAVARVKYNDNPTNIDIVTLGDNIWARNNNTWQKVQPHPKRAFVGGKGVSEDFTVLLNDGKTIMRNGKYLPISDLVLSTEWSDFRIEKMNDRGIMAGRAAKGGQDEVILLVPVEVVQPKVKSDGSKDKLNGEEQLEVVDEIRFARWRHGYVSNFNPIFRFTDADRFYIRMPHISGAEITCKIRSKGLARIQGGVGNQPLVNLTLENDPDYPDWLISKPLFLVSDVDDDTSYNGENTQDNAENDATHLASEESLVDIELSGDVNGTLAIGAKREVGKVRIKLSYLSMSEELAPHVVSSITSQFERTRDVFRQIGIKVVQDGMIEIINPNQTILDLVQDGRLETPSEHAAYANEIFHLYSREDIVHCIFTDYPIAPRFPGTETLGYWASNADRTKGYMLMNRREDIFVMAHELGHALGLAHTNENEVQEPYKLMSPIINSYQGDYKDGKRFVFGALDTCKHSTFYEVIDD